MSKSRNNFINIFDDPKSLKKTINKNIITDATPLEDPKEAEGSTVYELYKLVANESEALEMANALKAGGYGWGHAKKALLEALVDGFAEQREKFNYYMNHKEELDAVLSSGSERARQVAQNTLKRVRKVCGY